MLKLQPNPSFWTDVEIYVPGEGLIKFEAEYRFLDREQNKTWYDSLKDKTNIEALSEILLDWRGVSSPFGDVTLLQLLDNYPSAAHGFYKAYFVEMNGTADKPGVAEKNLGMPSATGVAAATIPTPI